MTILKPKATLLALTPEMEAALGGEKLELYKLPFRIGRQSRLRLTPAGWFAPERRRTILQQDNHLTIWDEGPRLQVSRRHLEINLSRDGAFVLKDLGSACGTIVDRERLGGHDKGGQTLLRDGSVIIVGTSSSPFIMKFVASASSNTVVRAMSHLAELHEEGILGEDTYEAKITPLRGQLESQSTQY